jgi:hypothetical protein
MLLADLPVELLGRLRSDQVLYFLPPPRRHGRGRPARHGTEFKLAEQASWPAAAVTTSTQTTRYGTAVACAWDRLHPRLTHRAAWEGHSDSELPILDGTLIRLKVDHLPGDRDPKPVWLWWSRTGAAAADVDRLWQAFLRRFYLEHTFRLFKQVMGWTAPKIRDPAAADRWSWLIIAAHTQLRLAQPMAADLRRPWENSPHPAGSPPPGSAAISGTSARRPPARAEEPPPSRTSQRRKEPQNGHAQDRSAGAHGLNGKLSA